ncbi:ladderlectin-like [Corythoichthys intestinalis]|uniref:ladderlectin-like n=1 Tax=Corythoichthys intestinalis TaxID=161448 RepID=UPI0025A57A20|nr:ladderlectin-like [Corythoichthys intestinalis]
MAFALRALLLVCGISVLFSGVWADGFVRVPCCPKGWHRLDDRCFRVVNKTKSFSEAEDYCVALEGNLASVRNNIEDEVVRALIAKDVGASATAWIGYNDLDMEGVFVWTDTASEVFDEFDGADPSTDDEDCVLIAADNEVFWEDAPCGDEAAFVCSQSVS